MTQENKQLIETVFQYMEETGQDSYNVNDISTALGHDSADEFKEIVKVLAVLERDKRVFLTKDGKFKLLEPEQTFIGHFSGTERGFGFVDIPDFDKDVFISPDKTNTALDGDTVRIDITKKAEPWNDKSAEGEIVEVMERGVSTIVGEFHAYKDDEVNEMNLYGYVYPQERKLKKLTVQIGVSGVRPVEGQIVLVEITQFPRYKDEDLIGIVQKVIGHRDDPGIDILSIAYKHGIQSEFPEEVLEEVEDIPSEVLPEELEGRRDLRDDIVVTIDGEDAKDLDDAIKVEKLDNGNYLLAVHIADVAHYVQAGTAIDKEAYDRGTSSYLIDRVIPMLPQKLSNGICSLTENVDRLTLSAEMEIDNRGEVVEYDIFPSVIRSFRRMTYTDVNRMLDDKDPAMIEKHADLINMFRSMQELHNILEAKRKRNGALSFDSNEFRFIMGEDGIPTSIELEERGVGERMIESFMLSANETVSEHYSRAKLPILYRVHEQPDEAKMQNFVEFATALGVRVKGTKGNITPKTLQGILDQVSGESYEQVVNMLMLRSMQKARYDVESHGHYGLATEFYSHFTAPIRRYPDLTLHRLIHYYDEVGTSKKDIRYWEKELPEIAEKTSAAERRAISAEREVEDLKMAEYMLDKVGQEFNAKIVSITNFGMFVQVEEAVEGLVHMSSMKDDYYEFNERGMILVGKRTGRQFRIGEIVPVKLVNVDVAEYNIDFNLVEDKNAKKKATPKKPNDHRKPKKAKSTKKAAQPKDEKKATKPGFEIRDRDADKTRKKRRNQRKNKRKKD